jgi:hypothetical protein
MRNAYKIYKILREIYHPVATPLIIGINLPFIVKNKKYEHVPLLIVLPYMYSGFQLGKEIYTFDKWMEERKKEEERRRK